MRRSRRIRGWAAGLVLVAVVAAGALITPGRAADDEPSRGVLEQANKFFERGNQFVQQGSFARAKTEFQKALKVYPKHLDALYNLAVCCERLNLMADAQEHYRHYTELAPNDPDGWNQLGGVTRPFHITADSIRSIMMGFPIGD